MLPGGAFVREAIRSLANKPKSPRIYGAINDRDLDFVQRYTRGETLAEIGASYGISRERVRQRLKVCGIAGKQGGQAVKSFLAVPAKAAARKLKEDGQAARCQRIWGITLEAKRAIQAASGYVPFELYTRQRLTAAHRGIPWQLTFGQWWDLWQEGERWAQRGRGCHRLCMARWADDGPYSVENIYICTNQENSRDYQVSRRLKPKSEQKSKTGHTGVYLMYPGLQKSFIARIGKKYVGQFATIEDAIAARELAQAA